MAIPDAHLASRARQAYERGRLASALARTLPLAALPFLAFGCGCQPRTTAVAGALFLAAAGFSFWRGGDFRRGAVPGIAAGAVPLLFPSVCQAACTHGCRPEMMAMMPFACAAGGIAGGILLALLAPRPAVAGMRPFVVACVVAALGGAVGCLTYGVVGLAIMVAGLSIGALPVLVLKKA